MKTVCDLIHPLTDQINILISQLENHLAVSFSLSVTISVISLPVDNFDQNNSVISHRDLIKKTILCKIKIQNFMNDNHILSAKLLID